MEIKDISNINKIKILSYNIWFSEDYRSERSIALIETIINNNYDVLCLQEVVPSVFNYLCI
jgi:mRNA deadenylase 3'-5' endonuclease subunit Ccr4